MAAWVIFGISFFIFALSFCVDKRSFRNVFFFLISLTLFVAAVNVSSHETMLTALVRLLLVLGMIAMIVMPIVFIWSGIVTIKREGFSLAHSLSILFVVFMWGAFALIVFLFTVKSDSTALMAFVVLLAAICFYILATFMGFFLYSALCLILPRRKKCDFVIIHGAGLLHGTEVSPLLACRLDKGAAVYNRSGPGTKMIVSGGQGSDEKVSEASAMKAYLVEKGYPENDIILEDQSKTTWENIRNSRAIIESIKQKSRVVFVTNDYHVFRTGYYAFRQHMKAEGVGCRTALYYWPNAFVREYIAIIRKEKVVPLLILAAWLIGTAVSFMPF